MPTEPETIRRPPWQRVRWLLRHMPDDYRRQRAMQAALNRHEKRLRDIDADALPPSAILARVRVSQCMLLIELDRIIDQR